MEKIVEIENRFGEQIYVINPKWEEKLYASSVSELNITSLINDGVIDPSNGMKVKSKNKTWFPYLCGATNSWSYRS